MYWGTLEARVFGDAEKAVVQWEEVMQVHGADSDRWRQYADCLWDALGPVGIERVRAVYKRAANCLTHSASATALFNAWLGFERIYGDLAGFDEAQRRQATKLTALVTREQQQYAQQDDYATNQRTARKERQPAKGKAAKAKATNKREAPAALPAKPAKRRRGTGFHVIADLPWRRQLVVSHLTSHRPGEEPEPEAAAATGEAKAEMDVAAESEKGGSAAERSDEAEAKAKPSQTAKPSEVETDGTSAQERTVRGAGLPFSMDEASVRKAFEVVRTTPHRYVLA